jgi:magnesium chelatase subunit D
MTKGLPFSAVVGQEEAKLALVLAACDRRIGGVLLRGDKGSAKSTLARGLAALLPGGAPFVELPLGATEDRVVGTLDITSALTEGSVRFRPGLLHAADGGVLYVDEINLLPDHLVDVLLDVAASGVNRVEREGVSHAHPSRFLLVGSMNPEEGDLRPQLLDRFGLAVEVRTPAAGGERAAALRRRLSFDEGLESFELAEAALAARLASWRPAAIPDELIVSVARLCAAAGAEGLRADLTICRAAAALAGWEGRTVAGSDDARRVAPLALVHRARRDPLDPAGTSASVEEALSQLDGEGVPPRADGPGAEEASAAAPGAELDAPPAPAVRPSSAPGRRGTASGPRGRLVGDRDPAGAVSSVAVGATVLRAAGRAAADGGAGTGGRAGAGGRAVGEARPRGALVAPADLREAVYEQKTASLIVLAVDASGSMGADRRMESAKGAVLGLLRDAYQRRDLVSMVTFRGEEAQVVLRPTASVEVARARLAELPTGGRTPLAAGLRAALGVATSPGRSATHSPLLVVITDARATSAPPGAEPVEAAVSAAAEIRRAGMPAVVIDVEPAAGAAHRLGLAAELASAMGAEYVALEELSPAAVERVVRGVSAAAGR